MKKLLSMALLMVLAVVMTGCFSAKPDKAVSDFIESGKLMDATKMATALNPDDKALQTQFKTDWEGSNNQDTKFIADYLKANAAKMTYTVKESKIDKDKAVVKVSIKFVDGGPIMKGAVTEFFKEAMPMAMSGTELTEEKATELMEKAFNNQIKTVKETTMEKELEVNCVKVKDKWYISEVKPELINAFVSNFITAGEELNKSFTGGQGQ